MLRDPKERFTSSTFSGAWGKIVQSEVFEEAIYATLNELLHQMPLDVMSPQVACDSHQQMVGARRYMELLCTIHRPTETPKPNQPTGLDYSHGV